MRNIAMMRTSLKRVFRQNGEASQRGEGHAQGGSMFYEAFAKFLNRLYLIFSQNL